MTKLMIIVGSVRPGRIGLPIAQWVQQAVTAHGGFEIDFVDLAELNLPLMDEPNHPRLNQYTKQHTFDWSARVSAAEAIILVNPEYNYSFTAAVKNAFDYLGHEWWRKPIGVVSYGGVSSGTRGAAALAPVFTALGLVRVGAQLELPFAGKQVAEGVFTPTERDIAILEKQLTELAAEAPLLKPLQAL